MSNMTATDRLDHFMAKARKKHGPEWDPLLRAADIAEEAAAAGDLKTALTGFLGVADRIYPKLKSQENTGTATQMPPIIIHLPDNVPQQELKTIYGIDQATGSGRLQFDNSPAPRDSARKVHTLAAVPGDDPSTTAPAPPADKP